MIWNPLSQAEWQYACRSWQEECCLHSLACTADERLPGKPSPNVLSENLTSSGFTPYYTAELVLQVDTNVGRIAARLGWLPLDAEKALEVGLRYPFLLTTAISTDLISNG